MMKYRSLGKSGLKVSIIGLGTNQFGGKVNLAETKEIIAAALDRGVNLFDTADIYQGGRSEEYIGKALKGKREKALIATKVFYKTGDGPNDLGASRQHIFNGIDESLKRLDTDWVDLYQIHQWDEITPIEETVQALDDLVRSGKIRYIGASNFSSWQLTHANAVARRNGWTEFVSIQPHYHMFEREIEKELIPACNYFKVGILPYFPLAGGFLTGKYVENEPAPSGSRGESSEYVQKYLKAGHFETLRKLMEFAQERTREINELAHAWLLAHPMVSSVISGATRVGHILANTKAAEWELTPEEFVKVNDLLG
jgi:aryl-alcohol dehydrogenase-like predicted oxidoreductase